MASGEVLDSMMIALEGLTFSKITLLVNSILASLFTRYMSHGLSLYLLHMV